MQCDCVYVYLDVSPSTLLCVTERQRIYGLMIDSYPILHYDLLWNYDIKTNRPMGIRELWKEKTWKIWACKILMKLISIDLRCGYDFITSNYRFEHTHECVWENIVAFLLNLNSSAVWWNYNKGRSVSSSFNLFPSCITLQWSSYTRNKNPQKYFMSEGKILSISSTSYIGFSCLAVLFRITFSFCQLNFLFGKRSFLGAQVAHSGPIQNACWMDTS